MAWDLECMWRFLDTAFATPFWPLALRKTTFFNSFCQAHRAIRQMTEMKNVFRNGHCFFDPFQNRAFYCLCAFLQGAHWSAKRKLRDFFSWFPRLEKVFRIVPDFPDPRVMDTIFALLVLCSRTQACLSLWYTRVWIVKCTSTDRSRVNWTWRSQRASPTSTPSRFDFKSISHLTHAKCVASRFLCRSRSKAARKISERKEWIPPRTAGFCVPW